MAAGNTYEAIATQTLGSAAASVTFSSIPGTYTDLVIVASHKATANPNYLYITLNGDTTSTYSFTNVAGNGTTATSARSTSITAGGGGSVAATNFSISILNFQNYANTTTYKTMLNRNGTVDVGTEATVSLWRSTAAITSILLSYYGNDFATGSTFSLYGIKAA
jgi:hypothetical protein